MSLYTKRVHLSKTDEEIKVIFTEAKRNERLTLKADETYLTADNAHVESTMTSKTADIAAATHKIFAIDVIDDYGTTRIYIYEEDEDEIREEKK